MTYASYGTRITCGARFKLYQHFIVASSSHLRISNLIADFAAMPTNSEDSRKAANTKKQRNQNIPWTPKKMVALLKQVQAHGAHLEKRGTVESSAVWKLVNVNFFKEPCMVDFQSLYNLAGLTTKKNVNKKKLHDFLEKAEADVLGPTDEAGALLRSNRRNHTIVKGTDGDIYDCRPLKARKEDNSGTELNKIVSVLHKVVDQHLGKENIEDGIESMMMAFVDAKVYSNEDLARACFDPIKQTEKYDAVLATIIDVEIATIINIYCSKGLKLEPAPFKVALERLGFSVLACNKLFMGGMSQSSYNR